MSDEGLFNMKTSTESLENYGSYQTTISLSPVLEERITGPAEVTHCPVNSYNEWDPLEEVIVGIVDGATFPSWHIAMEAPLPEDQREIFQKNAGRPFPKERIAAAKHDLEEFVHILEAEGVKVRRPVPMNQLQPYGAPGWVSNGLYDAMPRGRATGIRQRDH